MELFDDWPERYEKWFETPLGRLVKTSEIELVMNMLLPASGDCLLDVGCGTGIFSRPFLESGVTLVGLDVSHPMLLRARQTLPGEKVGLVRGDMGLLPFKDETFDHVLSVTALEFVSDGRKALQEFFRVTRPGGTVVVATLNRLGVWAWKRRRDAMKKDSIFTHAVFRNGMDLMRLAYPQKGTYRTCVHFFPYDRPLFLLVAPLMEALGKALRLKTGAFVAARWIKQE